LDAILYPYRKALYFLYILNHINLKVIKFTTPISLVQTILWSKH